MIKPQVYTQDSNPLTLFHKRVCLRVGDRLYAGRCLPAFALFIWLLFPALFPAGVTAAQEIERQPAIQQMKLQILPEYDDPRVLVIAQGRLDVAGGEFNGPITFRMPAEAQINQMAVLDLDLGGPESLPFEVEADPDDPAWMLVTYTLTNPHFFFEYYYNLPGGGSQKQFTFALNNLQDIGLLSLEVQQPLKAEGFTLEPAAANSRTDTAGFTYWLYPEQTVAAGEVIEIQTRYTKSDPNPSIVRQGEAAVQTTNTGAAVGAEAPEAEIPSSWVGITLVGVALVIGFGFLRHRIRPGRTKTAAALEPPTYRKPEPTAVTEPVQARYCTNCGERISGRINFCPYCGTGVRR